MLRFFDTFFSDFLQRPMDFDRRRLLTRTGEEKHDGYDYWMIGKIVVYNILFKPVNCGALSELCAHFEVVNKLWYILGPRRLKSLGTYDWYAWRVYSSIHEISTHIHDEYTRRSQLEEDAVIYYCYFFWIAIRIDES